MKTSKRILSAVLSLCIVLGCLATGFSALAADGTALQAAINAAIAGGDSVYEWTGGNVTLDDTLVINGDITVDFNNATVTGAPGKSVVNVKGGNVTLYNATFIAECEAYQGVVDFASTLLSYKPAVSINGGNVTLDCITAVGSTIRVPNSSSFEITSGNGINANAGNVVLKDVIAVGMKALDNTKATVVVEDAVLVGIYKAINIVNKVTFADGYSQYSTVDLVEELLKDGVSLSATEKKYIAGLTNSQGDLSVGSVIATAKDPSFTAPTSTYDAETDVLTVVAQADAENEKADVPNRYSYKYTPDTCTIDGVTADFVEQADGTYAATFENVAGGAELNAELDYNLSVKLGAKQKEIATKALDMVAQYADKAPEIIGRFIKDFEGERAYGKVNEYLDLIYGAYKDIDAVKNMPAVKKFMGVVYALKGMDFTGNTGNKGLVSQVNPNWNETLKKKAISASLANQEADFGKIFDTDGDGVADSLYAFKGDIGEGIGLLELFDEYYETVKSLALTADYSDFNDIGAAAEYIGANYEDILALVDAAIELVEYGYALLEDPDLKDFLGDNLGDISVIIDYADKLMAPNGYYWTIKAKYEALKSSSFIDKYGDRAPELCKRYALKALDIAQNPTKYFDINSKIEGDYFNVFNFTDTAVITTPADEIVEYCNVTVKVAGYGMFSVDGKVESVMQTYKVEKGEFFSVLPVEMEDGVELFRDYVLTQPNGSWQVVSSLANFRVGSDITITLNFSAKGSQADEDVNIIFLTDGNLGYNWIGDYDGAAADVDPSEVVVPEYKGMTFAGWSLDKTAAADAALTDEELIDSIADRTDDFFVYAVYDAQIDVEIPVDQDIVATVDTATKRVYFGTYVNLPDNMKAIEVGIIATKNADYATEENMTLALNGTAGVLVKMSDAYGDDGYLLDNLYYELGVKTASGTVYGRGYVIIKNLDTGAVETVYTSIASGTL
ncbi:MAG: hypothetical protein IJA87_05630 [Clostridia bacterium]|nr:hypothetical protein [Clostridia bacterium]